MPVQKGMSPAIMGKDSDLERLELALVQLGFALEQQEIRAEAERTRQEEARTALLERIGQLEGRLRDALAAVEGEPSPVAEEGR